MQCGQVVIDRVVYCLRMRYLDESTRDARFSWPISSQFCQEIFEIAQLYSTIGFWVQLEGTKLPPIFNRFWPGNYKVQSLCIGLVEMSNLVLDEPSWSECLTPYCISPRNAFVHFGHAFFKVSNLYLNVRWLGIETLKGFQIEYGQSEWSVCEQGECLVLGFLNSCIWHGNWQENGAGYCWKACLTDVYRLLVVYSIDSRQSVLLKLASKPFSFYSTPLKDYFLCENILKSACAFYFDTFLSFVRFVILVLLASDTVLLFLLKWW